MVWKIIPWLALRRVYYSNHENGNEKQYIFNPFHVMAINAPNHFSVEQRNIIPDIETCTFNAKVFIHIEDNTFCPI